MSEILLTLARARKRDRIPRILLDAQVVAICEWDPNERAMIEMDRE